ncbi:hypothetical protein GGI03_002026 [Coemansia sp. RSA 2337]|nr:hypothetical protein LPJ71_001771 [Coemansia sp. S17]KAJ2013004.1 hypothetical protein GGI14_005581 [Coemansia sp. S680]KAJ2034841.1 hypothetical protein H4S03_004705 [Coemansia sp. S3946]KAJ2047970.1 hypothetical protein H4S04_004122 [Coemansia sp. S16]KAJ2095617.1 hypothetical protein GGI16_005145 [Coemansia sp. S142-1]KAJ2114001.1 hypothetical protein IW146_003424 [Coemansia sp. RSA 922]KAJ2350628.1 hypothetical protein GGH92_002277 [Coemansia sp. RSA 2673]KAJ2466590.1 hypothetical pro
MSYVAYARQLSQWAWTAVETIHLYAFPLCGDFILRTSEQWSPLQTLLATVGPTTLTYILEAIVVYVGARLAIFVVRLFSDTLFRLLRLVLGIAVVTLSVALGLYFYFTSTANGKQQLNSAGSGFWVDQAMSFASRLAPAWDTPSGKWAGGYTGYGGNRPPPVNFQYQPPR